MTNRAEKQYAIIKWSAEFLMMPLHFLALAHLYSTAISIGAAVFVVYSIVSIQHLRAERAREMFSPAHFR